MVPDVPVRNTQRIKEGGLRTRANDQIARKVASFALPLPSAVFRRQSRRRGRSCPRTLPFLVSRSYTSGGIYSSERRSIVAVTRDVVRFFRSFRFFLASGNKWLFARLKTSSRRPSGRDGY